ncbi:hypothetical protein CsatB_007399 [Cannabis sativa]
MMFNTQGAQPLPIEKERKLIYLHGEIPSNKICLQAGQNLKISGEFLWKV